MLDPYYRLPLFPVGKGKFITKFKVPDKQGVFKFVLNITRLGYQYKLI